jgi:nicotinamidase-related amidase
LTSFVSGISSCVEAAFRSFAGLSFFVVILEFALADRAFGEGVAPAKQERLARPPDESD